MLAKIISIQGWRAPITVSNLSGFIVRGHCRLLAAQKLKLDEVPVDFQDYANEAEEWADLVADNRIAELAGMDNELLKDLLGDIDDLPSLADISGFTVRELEDLFNPPEPPTAIKTPVPYKMVWVLIGVQISHWSEVTEKIRDLEKDPEIEVHTSAN
jgi:hypothetical protein